MIIMISIFIVATVVVKVTKYKEKSNQKKWKPQSKKDIYMTMFKN